MPLDTPAKPQSNQRVGVPVPQAAAFAPALADPWESEPDEYENSDARIPAVQRQRAIWIAPGGNAEMDRTRRLDG